MIKSSLIRTLFKFDLYFLVGILNVTLPHFAFSEEIAIKPLEHSLECRTIPESSYIPPRTPFPKFVLDVKPSGTEAILELQFGDKNLLTSYLFDTGFLSSPHEEFGLKFIPKSNDGSCSVNSADPLMVNCSLIYHDVYVYSLRRENIRKLDVSSASVSTFVTQAVSYGYRGGFLSLSISVRGSNGTKGFYFSTSRRLSHEATLVRSETGPTSTGCWVLP